MALPKPRLTPVMATRRLLPVISVFPYLISLSIVFFSWNLNRGHIISENHGDDKTVESDLPKDATMFPQ